MADLIDGLIGYVKDIKPYHTKIFGVEVEYVTSEDINITVVEDLRFNLNLGLPVCENLTSIAVAVGDDDGWDTKPYDELPYDIIVTEADGYCIPRDSIHQSVIFDGQTYNIPTGFIDYIFTTVTEDLTIQGQVVGTDVEDCYTVINQLWDSPLDGIDTVEYGSNFIKVNLDLTSIFNLIPGFQFDIINSSFNDGTYTVDVATYDINTNETTITVLENTLDATVPDGIILVGLYDAFEWDGDSTTAVDQPPADINAKSTIHECLTITDGYGFDDPNVGWDATIDPDYNAPPGEEHNPLFFDSPVGWDDAYYIIDGSSSIPCKDFVGIGWDGQTYDSVLWDAALYNVPPGFKWDEGEWEITPWDSGVIFSPDALTPQGVVVFSPENMPSPNPTNIGSLFTQTTASTSWTVNHNFGYYPIVRVYSGGIEIIPTSIVHTSLNQVVISFNTAQVGEARLV